MSRDYLPPILCHRSRVEKYLNMSHRYNLLYAQSLSGLNLSWNAISSNLLMLLYHNWSACMMSKLSLHIKTIIIFNLYRQSTHSWNNFNFLLIKRPFFQSSSSPLLHSNKYKKLKYNNLLIRKKIWLSAEDEL